MAMKEGEVVSAALALPATSRVMIIKTLTDSLLIEEPVVDRETVVLEAAWFREAESRAVAYERGEIEALPGDQVIRNLRARTSG